MMRVHERQQLRDPVIVARIVEESDLHAVQLARKIEHAHREAVLCSFYLIERAQRKSGERAVALNAHIGGSQERALHVLAARYETGHESAHARRTGRNSRDRDAFYRRARADADARHRQPADPVSGAHTQAGTRDAHDVVAGAHANARDGDTAQALAGTHAQSRDRHAFESLARAHAQTTHDYAAHVLARADAEAADGDAFHVFPRARAEASYHDAAKRFAGADAGRAERNAGEIVVRTDADADAKSIDTPGLRDRYAECNALHHAVRVRIGGPDGRVQSVNDVVPGVAIVEP